MPKTLKNHYFIAFVVLIAVVVVAFWNIVFSGKTLTTSSFTVGTTRTGPYLYEGDRPPLPITDGAASAWHFEPAMELNSQAYRSGRLPLWNAYNGAGQPLAADMQSSSFYPLALPVLLNPSPAMWDFFLLLRLLVAGFLMFIFLRLINLKTVPSVAGAITFMLSGYFVFWINMAHLNVEILIPLFLVAIELIFQRKNLFSIGLLAISSALVILGGMPESAAVTYLFAGAYFIFRAFKEYKKEAKWNSALKPTAYFSVAILAGLAISVTGWLPFLEYSKIFWSKHIDKLTGPVSLNPYFSVQFLAPRFLSALHNTSYVGVIPLLLVFGVRKKHQYKWFFIISALVVFLKVFGVGVNWIGYLPVLKKIYLFKYSQALLAFSVATLTAMAIDSGLKASWWRIASIGAAWAGAYYFFFKFTDFFTVNRLILNGTLHAKVSIVFLVLAALVLLVPRIFKKPIEVYIALAITLLIFLEMWVHIPRDRADRFDPYIAPPFVKYLQQQKGLFRTYGLDAVLWPNTNAAYKLEDIRSLNALQPLNYMTYLSLFSDLRKLSHVTGLEGVNLESQFLDALNVRYIISLKPFQKNLDYWLERKEKAPAVRIGGEIWFKAPFSAKFKFPNDVRYLNLKVQSGQKENFEISATGLKGSIGFEGNPKSGEDKIDKNMGFVKDQTQTNTNKSSSKSSGYSLFKEVMDRGVSSRRINIASLAGQSLKISFSGNVNINSVYYSNGGDLNAKFKPVYTDNKVEPAVTIYENKKAMSRVVVYDKVKTANGNPLAALKKLNIRKEALTRTPIKLDDNAKLRYTAKAILYEPQKVKIKVKTNKKSLLVLADTYYPGWKAYVDGVEKEIIETNLMFKGVLIGPATKEVVFAYEPAVYKTGFTLTGVAMLAFLALILTKAGIAKRKKIA